MTISRLPDNFSNTPLALTESEWRVFDSNQDHYRSESCMRSLHIGFFFDGTRNNMERDMYDKEKPNHSNVARLNQVFETAPKTDELYDYRYQNYISGVGTQFWKQIGDSGMGAQAMAGAAAGWGGEARVNWALLQLQNNLHFYAKSARLTTEAEDLKLVRQMSADIHSVKASGIAEGEEPAPGSEADVRERLELSKVSAVWNILQTQNDLSNMVGRKQVLAARHKQLREKGVAAVLQQGPNCADKRPRIGKIRLSVFGFSRGATEARVFVNWLRDLSDDPQSKGALTLFGIPLEIDILGLFDTVASVGVAQSAFELAFSGHGGWARPRYLRIPPPALVKRCLHLVSAHEVRGSFPLDTATGVNVEEVVYPGVHSDLGGGYKATEQGRSMTDSLKLSQLPLCHMYRAARAAGVPLIDFESPEGKDRIKEFHFEVDPQLINDFNQYIEAVRAVSSGATTTEALLKVQYRLYLRWRRQHLKKGERFPGVDRCDYIQDRVDLVEANKELILEEQLMQDTETLLAESKAFSYVEVLNKYSKRIIHSVFHDPSERLEDASDWSAPEWWETIGFRFSGPVPAVVLTSGGWAVNRVLEALARVKWLQWRELKDSWLKNDPVPAEVDTLYTHYVHDSRAWFKPLADDDDVWELRQRQELARIYQMRDEIKQLEGIKNGEVALIVVNMRHELEALEKKYHEQLARLEPHRDQPVDERVKKENLPFELLPMQKTGREFFALWGYLRWRTLYSDDYSIYQAQYPALANSRVRELNARRDILQTRIEHLNMQAKSASTPLVTSGNGPFGMGVALPIPGEAQRIESELAAAKKELAAVDYFLDDAREEALENMAHSKNYEIVFPPPGG